MILSVLDNALWAAGFIGHLALLLIVLIRKTLKGFGSFKTYLFFKVALTTCLFFVSKYAGKHAYFLVYWIGGYIDYGIQFTVIIAIARYVLGPVKWWLRDARKVFVVCGTFAVVAAGAVSLGVSRPGARGFDLWENRVSIFLLLIMCGILVVVSSIASFFHLYRRRHILAIGNGLFVVLYSVLLQDLADVVFAGSRVDTIAAYLSMFLYVAVLMYWIVALWEREKELPAPSAEMKAQVVALYEQVQYDLNKVNGPRQ